MSHQFCLDANVPITAWDVSYPNDLFPSLWEKLSANKDRIIFVAPIFDEIERSYKGNSSDEGEEQEKQKYPLRQWLLDNSFSAVPIGKEVEEKALELEGKYQPKNIGEGVNASDIKLIAYALCKQLPVITFEAVQPQSPDVKSNYKIPLVCAKEGVECKTFVDFLRELGISI